MKFSLLSATALATFVSAESCASTWGQCGGNGWTGATCCPSGAYCAVQNEWYHQCLPGTDTAGKLLTHKFSAKV